MGWKTHYFLPISSFTPTIPGTRVQSGYQFSFPAPKLNGSSELSVQPPPVLEAEPGQKKGRIPCSGRPESSSSWQSPQSVRLLRFSLKMDKLQSPNGLEKGCDQCEMVLV